MLTVKIHFPFILTEILPIHFITNMWRDTVCVIGGYQLRWVIILTQTCLFIEEAGHTTEPEEVIPLAGLHDVIMKEGGQLVLGFARRFASCNKVPKITFHKVICKFQGGYDINDLVSHWWHAPQTSCSSDDWRKFQLKAMGIKLQYLHVHLCTTIWKGLL